MEFNRHRVDSVSDTTVHLVYPHGEKVSCPDAIGRHLAERLSKRYRVLLYDWQVFGKIRPGPNDVLIGHACPVFMTLFRRSYRISGWKRVLLMTPYCHGEDHSVAFIERLIRHCDLHLAITGNYWFQGINSSGFAHWQPKMRHLDLAVDRSEYPPLKRTFNRSGSRRFLYVGSGGFTSWTKNTRYLVEIAAAMPDTDFGWAGATEVHGRVQPLGMHDFSTEKSRSLVANYDFLITVGNADPNPATILEGMAWGLIPVCTPQSGYHNYESIVNVPLGSLSETVDILTGLQNAPDRVLHEMQEANWGLLKTHFNWDRFADQVVAAIESKESPQCLPVSRKRMCELLISELTNPLWRNLLDPKKITKRVHMLGVKAEAASCQPRY